MKHEYKNIAIHDQRLKFFLHHVDILEVTPQSIGNTTVNSNTDIEIMAKELLQQGMFVRIQGNVTLPSKTTHKTSLGILTLKRCKTKFSNGQ